jgi:glycosyltransferase involved in cell wall biosynthesis
MPTCAFVSFRLGGTDGVSVVADQWMDAFRSFGFDVFTVAGELPADHVEPGLAIDAREPPSERAVRDLLHAADLVVVENLLTIPMNLPASRVVARVLRGRPAVLHHHDPPWQRDRYRDVTELPIDDPAWKHVVINDRTAKEFASRGIDATVIYNGFADPRRPGARDLTRAALGVEPDELLVVHPVRAIARKAIPDAIEFATQLGATYWLTGPAEEDYADELGAQLRRARTKVIHRAVADLDDVYAASDVVVYPSRWEGFGNPPIEASLRRRPVAVGAYPVLEEIRRFGFRWFDVDDPGEVAEFLAEPDPTLLDHNRDVARRHFAQDRVAEGLYALPTDAGWVP